MRKPKTGFYIPLKLKFLLKVVRISECSFKLQNALVPAFYWNKLLCTKVLIFSASLFSPLLILRSITQAHFRADPAEIPQDESLKQSCDSIATIYFCEAGRIFCCDSNQSEAGCQEHTSHGLLLHPNGTVEHRNQLKVYTNPILKGILFTPIWSHFIKCVIRISFLCEIWYWKSL